MTLFDRHKRDWLDEYEASADDETPPLQDCLLDYSHRVPDDTGVSIRDGYGSALVDGEYCDSNNVNMTPATVPLCVLGEVQLRFLCPDDLEEVRALCQVWFPIGK